MFLVRFMVLVPAFALAALAENIAFTSWPECLKVGQPATVKWAGGNSEPANITLLHGEPSNLHDVKVLTQSATGGEFTWIPDADLPNDPNYVFQISQGDQVNYSGKIPLTGGSDIPFSSAFEGQDSGIEAAPTSGVTSLREASNYILGSPTASTSRLLSTAAASSTFEPLNAPFSGPVPSSTSVSATEQIHTGVAQHVEAPLALGMGVAGLLALF